MLCFVILGLLAVIVIMFKDQIKACFTFRKNDYKSLDEVPNTLDTNMYNTGFDGMDDKKYF